MSRADSAISSLVRTTAAAESYRCVSTIRRACCRARLGGGSQDFIANAIYDQFFRTADQGLGAALALLLVVLGSVFVAIVISIFGAGTLGMGGKK